jgi:ABC-2 type transport system permease protein
MAGSIFILFKTLTDWHISAQILDGSIIIRLVRPLDFQLQMLFLSAGCVLANFVFITIPSICIILLLFHSTISLGVALVFFPISLVLAFVLSFIIDYVTGITSFYTESLWGISITKDVIVSFLSGSLIPIQFFPQDIQNILKLLPFQAIYHIPLTLVTSRSLDLYQCLSMLLTQLLWVLLLFAGSRLFYSKAIQSLSISGG